LSGQTDIRLIDYISDSEGMVEMKSVKTEEAVGHVLCHDITQIIKDIVKDAVFRRRDNNCHKLFGFPCEKRGQVVRYTSRTF